jgi:hypothetical protein
VKKTKKETYEVGGDDLLRKIKELIKKGNVRKVTVKDSKDNTIIVVPLTAGVVGSLLAPHLAAICVVIALVTNCKIEVERESA